MRNLILLIVLSVFMFFASLSFMQWLWSFFAPVFKLPEIGFWQLSAMWLFFILFCAPLRIKRG